MIKVDSQNKILLARFGANKIFDDIDFKKRQNMSDDQLILLFDRVWNSHLEKLTSGAEIIEYEEVSRRLLDKYHKRIDATQEHRSFYFRKAEFIAQLEKLEDSVYSLNRLWRVASSDSHPRTLFVTFDSVEEKERFVTLSRKLGMNEEELGLRLIRNFMDIVANKNSKIF